MPWRSAIYLVEFSEFGDPFGVDFVYLIDAGNGPAELNRQNGSEKPMATQKRVVVDCMGRLDRELFDEALGFAASVNPDDIVLQDGEDVSDALMREFTEATPEWTAPKGSPATDARDGICFSVVSE